MKNHLLITCLLFFCTANAIAQQVPAIPVVSDYSKYTGTSFVANWEAASGAKSYLLSVFSCDQEEDTAIIEDFAKVNAKDGEIDAANPNFPEGWDVNASTVSTKGGKQQLALTKAGEYILCPQTPGPLSRYVIRAHVEGDNVTDDNALAMRISFIDAAGNSQMYADAWITVYQQYNELNVFDIIGGRTMEIYTAIKLSIEARDGHETGQLVIDDIQVEHMTPTYVVHDEEVKKTSYTVEGLNPESVYWYHVSARNDNGVSHRSELMRVDGFLIPRTGEAGDATETSYVANWPASPKADSYIVTNYTVRDGKGKVAVLEDHFSNAKEGTFDNPIELQTTDESDLYADTKGWNGNLMVVAQGMLGAAKPLSYYMRGWLETPATDLRANNGRYTVSIKARGMKGDKLTIYPKGAYDPETAHVTAAFASDGATIEEKWSCTGGKNGVVLSIEPKSNKFFIEEITITQNSSDGIVVKKLDRSFATDKLSCEFTDLTPGEEYGYTVRARRENYIGRIETTDESELQRIKLPGGDDRINALSQTASSRLLCIGNMLQVDMDSDHPFTIYDAQGRQVFHFSGHKGHYNLPVPAPGIYFLKVQK